MKKLVFHAVLFLSGGMIAYGLPVGNPTDASLLYDGVFWQGGCEAPCEPFFWFGDRWSVRVGYYGDFVFNRHMEVHQLFSNQAGGSGAWGPSSDIHETQLTTNAGLIVLNFCNYLDFFATIGGTDIRLRTPRSAFRIVPTDNEFVYLETQTDFSWSLGGRATLFKCGCLAVGVEGQYFNTGPRIDFFMDADNIPQYFNRSRVKYSEWQVGIGISSWIGISGCGTALVPYIASKWSRAKIDMHTEPVASAELMLFDLCSKKPWGYAFGVTLVGCNKASVTAEARFVDEKAFHLNGQLRF